MHIPGRVLDELAATTRFGDVRLLDEVDSTNRYALEAARAGATEGLVVVAEHQSAGRGRLGRRWDARSGDALLVSILLQPVEIDPDGYHLLTAAVSLAAADAVSQVAGVEAGLKWPNDLVVGEAKLAGVLAESIPGSVVVGLGLNVAGAPPGGVALAAVAGRPVPREQLLVVLLEGLERRCCSWAEVGAEYRERCATVGRAVTVEGPPGRLRRGDATGIDSGGRLVVAFEQGEEALTAADVTHLRPRREGGEAHYHGGS